LKKNFVLIVGLGRFKKILLKKIKQMYPYNVAELLKQAIGVKE